MTNPKNINLNRQKIQRGSDFVDFSLFGLNLLVVLPILPKTSRTKRSIFCSTRVTRPGAAMELSMLSGLLGAVPGVSFTSFYSSMGFIIDRCKDTK